MGTRTIEQVVGARVREARESLGMSQQTLGDRLAPWLGQPLARQTLYAIEAGNRAFAVAELLAFAFVLDRPPWWFLIPTGSASVRVGEQDVSRRRMAGLLGVGQADVYVPEARLLIEVKTSIQGRKEKALSLLRKLEAELAGFQSDADVVSEPAAKSSPTPSRKDR